MIAPNREQETIGLKRTQISSRLKPFPLQHPPTNHNYDINRYHDKDRKNQQAVYPNGDRGGNQICIRPSQTGKPMDLHRFWDGLITSSQNVARLRNEATALSNRPEFSRSQLTELARGDFDSWAKESFEIATKIAYQNGAVPGTPKTTRGDCSEVANAAILPAGYVKVGGRIADQRIILAAYRLAELLKSL